MLLKAIAAPVLLLAASAAADFRGADDDDSALPAGGRILVFDAEECNTNFENELNWVLAEDGSNSPLVHGGDSDDAPAPAAAPADAGSVDMSWFAEGVQATLIGLEKAPEMNGQLVSILDPVPQPADGKILVRIISTGNEAKVPPHNLQFAAAAPADTLHTPAPAPDDDAGPAPVIVPAPDPGADDDPGGADAPAKWEFELNGDFKPYDDDNNDKIEAAYQKYLANNKHKSTSSVEITVNGKWDFTLSFHYMNSTSHGHKKNRSKIQRTPP